MTEKRSIFQPAEHFQPAEMEPTAESVAEVRRMRYTELRSICDRLARLSAAPRGTWREPAGWTAIGAGLGAIVAALPIFASDAKLASWVSPVYVVLSVALVVLGGVLLHACRDVRLQRTETVGNVHTDMDGLLARYSLGGDDT